MESIATTSKLFCFLLFVSLVLNCFTDFRSDAQLLPLDEVKALETISARLQIKHFTVNQSLCSSGSFQIYVTDTSLTNITCNCSATVCHVTNIQMNSVALTGILPEEFVNLSNLQEIDLSNNDISGPIPKTLAKLPSLTTLSLSGNRINDSIPEEIGDIATLKELNLSDNYISGPIPKTLAKLPALTILSLRANRINGSILDEIGDIANLELLDLSNNYISGPIPKTLAKLPSLTILNLWGNSINGSIPEEIGDIATLEELNLSDNYINGPIPKTLAKLLSLTILNLGGNSINGSIPEEIGAIATLKELVLQQNELVGSLPEKLGNLSSLRKLELSSNYISGPIPKTLAKLQSLTILNLWANRINGSIPKEIGDIATLEELNLSDNYISGPIPKTLAKLLSLTMLNLWGNRINGLIPEGIGDIATLAELVLEQNELVGSLPEKLGNLSCLRKLTLSANNLTGTIPNTFSKLKNLTDFRIDGNGLSGKIPDLIGNWIKIERLDMQGTSMDGPIPSTISHLKNLTELRISDLNGSSTKMPNLDLLGMTNLTVLVLRNCLITGQIPNYIGDQLPSLKALDLSFNMLTGEIPTTFKGLDQSYGYGNGYRLRYGYGYRYGYMFLTNNLLTGVVPDWIITSNNKIDISYNNFTQLPESSSQFDCQSSANLNLVSIFPPTTNGSIRWCLKKGFPCSTTPQYRELFINCGGGPTRFEGHEYEADSSTGSEACFIYSSEKWAYSIMGLFMDTQNAPFIANNTFSLTLTNDELYSKARIAPTSLKYYGLCLLKGSYKVRLYFAEIMFSDGQNFSSLGRRIFDISIQGKVVRKDFNIMEEAKGVGKGIHVDFDDVTVNGSTLEIHLYWSGKGTTAIPDYGTYGPLISAIAVTPNLHTGLSAGAIAGIVVASCVLLVLILVVLRMKGYLGRKDLEDKELRALHLQTGYFSLRQIKAATNNFDHANKIGEGGFGPVYKGVLSDGVVIAVKQLSTKSKQGNREFVNEIGMISALQHPNLVRLYGCCIEGNQLLLIYEYMENNSLARALFGHEEHCLKLDWPTRKRICVGIARGLAYLHEESRLKIVHRDIKATNVLLDKDLNAKISDFGLAKLDEEENTHISTRIAGTVGYMAPEYATRGYLTDKADVYSFGIVALEIVSGKSNTNYRPKQEFVYLLDWAYVLQEQGSLLSLVDSNLGPNYPKEEVMNMLNVALLCTNISPSLRPSMSSVVSMLEGQSPIQAPVMKRSSLNEDMRFKAFEKPSQDSQTYVSAFSVDSQVQGSISMDGSWIDSSVSIPSNNEVRDHSSSSKLLPDLYDVNLDR